MAKVGECFNRIIFIHLFSLKNLISKGCFQNPSKLTPTGMDVNLKLGNKAGELLTSEEQSEQNTHTLEIRFIYLLKLAARVSYHVKNSSLITNQRMHGPTSFAHGLTVKVTCVKFLTNNVYFENLEEESVFILPMNICYVIYFIPKWRPVYYSFICMLISALCFIFA